MNMTKYIKVTGVGGTTNTVIPCNDFAKMSIDTVAPLTAVDLKYFDTDLDAHAIILQTSPTTTEKLVEQANFLADKIVEALQLPYEKPMLEVPADGFPSPITSITIT
jgi:hypothetical protein